MRTDIHVYPVETLQFMEFRGVRRQFAVFSPFQFGQFILEGEPSNPAAASGEQTGFTAGEFLEDIFGINSGINSAPGRTSGDKARIHVSGGRFNRLAGETDVDFGDFLHGTAGLGTGFVAAEGIIEPRGGIPAARGQYPERDDKNDTTFSIIVHILLDNNITLSRDEQKTTLPFNFIAE